MTLSIKLVDASFLCPRKAWLMANEPDRAVHAEDAPYWRQQAEEVEASNEARLRQVFKLKSSQAPLERTRELLDVTSKTGAWHRPQFEYKGFVYRPFLLALQDGSGVLTELSISTGDEHGSSPEKMAKYALELALGAHILKKNGIKAHTLRMRMFRKGLCWDGTDKGVESLFQDLDLSALAQQFEPYVEDLLTHTLQLTDAKELPACEMGRKCRRPVPCVFKAYCESFSPVAGPTIFDLPGSLWRWQAEREEEGRLLLGNIDKDELPTAYQDLYVSLRSQKPLKRAMEPGHILRNLPYPRYYFDFEAIASALPLWPNRAPYEQVPFQWSAHVETKPGHIQHKAFLDLGYEDPAERCAQALVDLYREQPGPVLVYHASYEKNRLKEMAQRFEALAPTLLAMIDHLVDLEPIVREHWFHPQQKGSYSLKKVVKCFMPELAYEGLEQVRNGVDAQMSYLSLVRGSLSAADFKASRHALLNYCNHDTWALVALTYGLLKKPIPPRPPMALSAKGRNRFDNVKLSRRNQKIHKATAS